jgi:hypothetical protein
LLKPDDSESEFGSKFSNTDTSGSASRSICMKNDKVYIPFEIYIYTEFYFLECCIFLQPNNLNLSCCTKQINFGF